jgi:hypothetical protein
VGTALGARRRDHGQRLAAAIRQAGRRAWFNGDVGGATVEMRFGEQLHARVVQDGADDDARDPGQVAAYVAKYSCKGSHERPSRRGRRVGTTKLSRRCRPRDQVCGQWRPVLFGRAAR